MTSDAPWILDLAFAYECLVYLTNLHKDKYKLER